MFAVAAVVSASSTTFYPRYVFSTPNCKRIDGRCSERMTMVDLFLKLKASL